MSRWLCRGALVVSTRCGAAAAGRVRGSCRRLTAPWRSAIRPLLMTGLILLTGGYACMPSMAATDASLADTFKACKSFDLTTEERVGACTQLLAVPDISSEAAALAHFYRALAQLVVKGLPDDVDYQARAQAAIPDINAAIALDPDLIAAYRYRANLYRYTKQFDASIADVDKVIAAFPKVGGLYVLRSSSLREAGHLDAALADYETALSIAGPDDDVPLLYLGRFYLDESAGHWDQALTDLDKAAPALKTQQKAFWAAEARGRVEYLSGRFDAAVAELLKAQDLSSDKDQYYLLWLYLAELHKGQDAAANLNDRLSFVDTAVWPGPILQYFAGARSLDQVKVPKDASDWEQRGGQCELEFFMGEVALAKGDRAAAIQHFHAAVATGITNYIEYFSAQAELQRLGQ
jgi:lipoprotein NlpI